MPPDWPCNEREYHLEKVFRATEDFLCKPSYLTKEILIIAAKQSTECTWICLRNNS